MSLDVQFKIKENPNYLRYLRQNAHWYKQLNRNSNNFRHFEEEVKRVYKMTRSDRIAKTLDTIEMFEKLLAALK